MCVLAGGGGARRHGGVSRWCDARRDCCCSVCGRAEVSTLTRALFGAAVWRQHYGDMHYPITFGGELHYPVGFLWKSESEMLGEQKPKEPCVPSLLPPAVPRGLVRVV